METKGNTAGAVTLTPSKSKVSHKSKLPENANPNLNSPDTKASKSPAIKSATKVQKKPNQVASPSPRNKIRERKFVVAKKNSKKENSKTPASINCKCKASSNSKKCLCVAYETLRASQEGFFKIGSGNPCLHGSEVKEEEVEMKTMNLNGFEEKSGEGESVDASEVTVSEKVKRRRDKLLQVARQSIPEGGCGRVMHLVKAFETALTLPKSKTSTEDEEQSWNEEIEGDTRKVPKWELPGLRPKAPVTEFSSSDLYLTRESLGLDSRAASSSSGSSNESVSNRNSCGGRRRHSRRNSSESSATFRGTREKRRTLKATPPQPFNLKTEQRGRSKQEEFMKKVQEMTIEQEKQRIPVAKGLPWTTDEPECLTKPPVKEITRPVDLVLHSDMRAMERAEFDHQVQEKLSFIEQFKLERERQQKQAEEEELRRLRKELVPKAQPMPYFDRPFIPKRSEKQPTLPKDPKFHKKMNAAH